jgi:hypothetical protein
MKNTINFVSPDCILMTTPPKILFKNIVCLLHLFDNCTSINKPPTLPENLKDVSYKYINISN